MQGLDGEVQPAGGHLGVGAGGRWEVGGGGQGIFLRRVGTLVVKDSGEKECEDVVVDPDDQGKIMQGVQVTCEHEVN